MGSEDAGLKAIPAMQCCWLGAAGSGKGGGRRGGGHCFEAYWNGKGNEEEIWAPGIRCSGERWENARLVVRGKSPRAFLTQILTCVIRLGRMQTSPLCLLEQDATEGRFIFFFYNLLQAGELLASRAKKKSSKCR